MKKNTKKITARQIVNIDGVWFQTPKLKFKSMNDAEAATKYITYPETIQELPVGSKVYGHE